MSLLLVQQGVELFSSRYIMDIMAVVCYVP